METTSLLCGIITRSRSSRPLAELADRKMSSSEWFDCQLCNVFAFACASDMPLMSVQGAQKRYDKAVEHSMEIGTVKKCHRKALVDGK